MIYGVYSLRSAEEGVKKATDHTDVNGSSKELSLMSVTASLIRTSKHAKGSPEKSNESHPLERFPCRGIRWV